MTNHKVSIEEDFLWFNKDHVIWYLSKQPVAECWILLLLSKTIHSLHNRLTFDLGKKNKIFYYNQKEHLKISRIAKLGGEML